MRHTQTRREVKSDSIDAICIVEEVVDRAEIRMEDSEPGKLGRCG